MQHSSTTSFEYDSLNGNTYFGGTLRKIPSLIFLDDFSKRLALTLSDPLHRPVGITHGPVGAAYLTTTWYSSKKKKTNCDS